MNILKKTTFASIMTAIAITATLALPVFANDSNKHDDKMVRMPMMNSLAVDVHFGTNGRVAVTGAKVTSVSGSIVNATTIWGSAGFNWVVNTDSNTKFNRKLDSGSSLSEISVGDTISFSGVVNPTAGSPLNVNAANVKDWSIQKGPFKTTIQGKVKTASPLVVTADNTDYTINVASSTAILNSLWLRIPLTSLQVNDTVRVYGTINSNNTIDATVVRDTNLH